MTVESLRVRAQTVHRAAHTAGKDAVNAGRSLDDRYVSAVLACDLLDEAAALDAAIRIREAAR